MGEGLSFRQLFSLFLIAALATLIAATLSAWTGPTATPPDANVSAPINVGDTSQIKTGGLWAASMGTDSGYCIGPSCITSWPSSQGSSLSGIRGYTAVGTHTWSKPASLSYVVVEVWGGGGGGGTSGWGTPVAGTGGTSSFGSHASAGGGTGVGHLAGAADYWTPGYGGVATGGDINVPGNGGGMGNSVSSGSCIGGYGAGAPRGGGNAGGNFSGTFPGGGGSGQNGVTGSCGAGGGSGGYSMKRISASSLSNSETVTIGGGGAPGGANAGYGAGGMVIVYEYIQ